jgi:hypothetical protein
MRPRASIDAPSASLLYGTPSAEPSPQTPPCVDSVDGVDRPTISVATLVQELAERGIRLVVEDGGIVAEGALERLTDADVAVIRAHKADVMRCLHAEPMADMASGPETLRKSDLAGGRLPLVRHAHRCRCGRPFKCTAPYCAGKEILCVCCKVDEIERRHAATPARRRRPVNTVVETEPDGDDVDAEDGDSRDL